MRPWLLLTALLGCGGSASAWTPEDTTSATNVANGALSLEAVCDRDGGSCPGAAVRAIERGTYCAAAAQLVRHRQDVPDGGPRCTR